MIYARQSPGYAISVAYDIVHSHPDVIAVFGDFMAEDMAADAEVYGYYKIPQCTGNAYTLPLRNRAKYPYYFQTITVTGYAEALGLLLKSWNVKRIAFLAPGTYLGENSLCGYLANSLHNAGFDVISRMVYYDVQSETLDFIASSFERVNARYIFACGSADTLAHMYYGLAKKKRLVGNDYVWIMDNVPYPYNDPIPLWGPHYYKDARGIINLFAGNTMNTFMKEVEYKLQYSAIAMQAGNGKTISLPFMEYWTNMGNMYDCPRIFATGLENLMRSDPTITADMISKRALQEKNFGLFQSTGYRGITGDPVTLTEHGDVAAAFNIFCVDGLSEDMNSPQFALTDPSVTKIMQWKRYQPTFYNGSSIPPPDGPIYTHISIDPNSRSGMMLKVFSASGISLAILFSLVVLIFRNKPAIRSGSVVFLIIMALGTIPSHASHLFYIGIPTAFRCQARLWLQLASYALCLGSILSKNSRVLLIYSAKKTASSVYRQGLLLDLYNVWAFCCGNGTDLDLVHFFQDESSSNHASRLLI
ncbi:periplasmic binding protein-like I [Obelidium mucronatum]|nr:periplasmic binding protein-like I [Obelidium mucronatum]